MTDSQLPACALPRMDALWCMRVAVKPMKPDASRIQLAAYLRVSSRSGPWTWMATAQNYLAKWVVERKDVKMLNSPPTDNLQSGPHENNYGLRLFRAPRPPIN